MQQRTVWITGASSGLGFATAKAFAGAGWRVIGGARSFPESGDEADGMHRLRLDVTDEASCKAFADKAFALSERVDALVCAAAVLVLGACENTAPQEYSRVMDTNFVGLTRMVQLALPAMRQQQNGRIVLSGTAQRTGGLSV